MKLLLKYIFISLLTICLPSCDLTGKNNGKDDTVSDKIKDNKAYNLGAEHARILLENVSDEAYVQDGLLDARARMSNIQAKLGRQSSADYERGFTDHIRKNCDSLARLIF